MALVKTMVLAIVLVKTMVLGSDDGLVGFEV